MKSALAGLFWPIQIAAGVTVMRDGEPDAKYSLHALRHACAALWIEQGFGPKRVQTLMGQTASVAMTFDRYGYLFEAREADEQAMTAICGEADRLGTRKAKFTLHPRCM